MDPTVKYVKYRKIIGPMSTIFLGDTLKLFLCENKINNILQNC